MGFIGGGGGGVYPSGKYLDIKSLSIAILGLEEMSFFSKATSQAPQPAATQALPQRTVLLSILGRLKP